MVAAALTTTGTLTCVLQPGMSVSHTEAAGKLLKSVGHSSDTVATDLAMTLDYALDTVPFSAEAARVVLAISASDFNSSRSELYMLHAKMMSSGVTVYVFSHYPTRALYFPISAFQLSLSRQQEKLDDATDTENLCDLVGTVVAYAAYASLPVKFKSTTLAGLNVSSERLFFISHCLTSCAQLSHPGRRYAPFRSRCIVPLMNMPEFSNAFGCAPGTPMNPRNKCEFW
ncbi:hypothetical protein MTO96_025239 [Rhipicephalus appendiculatus]